MIRRVHQLLRTSYDRAPLPLKKTICCLPYGWLAGSAYRKVVHLCQKLDSMSREDAIRLQEAELGRLLEFAVEQVPFYEAFRSVVRRLSPFDAMGEFPLLSKEDVQKNGEKLVPYSIGGIPHHEGTTGGSSGNQLKFLEDNATYAREMAFMHSQWKRVGYTSACRKATFRGVAFRKITDTCFWQENPIHNELQFSPFHMAEETLPLYVDQLIAYRAEFIHGYPSAIDVLAEYVIRHGLTSQFAPVNAVLLCSEECGVARRARIEAAFRTRAYTWYGHSERTVLGGECECSQAYHAFPAYGVLEIIREDGTPCDIGEQGEIVGTGFLNRSMPLIRYRTDDYARRESYACKCGRNWDRFSDVVGRWNLEGSLIGKSGARISSAALNMHGDFFRNVIRYQYYQMTAGHLIVKVIPSPGFSSEDERMIVAEHQKKLWGEMDIIVQRVDHIPLTSAGKQRRVVCDVELWRQNGTANAATEVR
jgi:phenylacetate-CoA ligase